MIEFYTGIFIGICVGFTIGFIVCGLILNAKRNSQPASKSQVEQIVAPPKGGTGESNKHKYYRIFVGEC